MSTHHRISFRRILCPIGLTPDSDEALRYAMALTRSYGAKLSVLHCLGNQAAANAIERFQIGETLDYAIKKHIGRSTPARFETEIIVTEGDPQIAITREAANRRIDLIVMRSRRRPYAAALLGSTAESVCRTAPCPVLVTHQHEQRWAGMRTGEVGLQRVLVAYDFSSDSELALAHRYRELLPLVIASGGCWLIALSIMLWWKPVSRRYTSTGYVREKRR